MMTDDVRLPEVFAGELNDQDLEAIVAGKGLGGPIVPSYHDLPRPSLARFFARALDERSIRLVGA